MNVDDLVLVSIDDHVVEPPNMFDGRLPAKYVDHAPRVVKDDNGVDRWMYRGNQTGVVGLNAVGSWPGGVGLRPRRVRRDAPGCYDIHARVRDMDPQRHHGVDVLPDVRRLQRRPLPPRQGRDDNAVIRAYNDWHIEEWAARTRAGSCPCRSCPTWDPPSSVAEIERVAAKGAKAITMPELPHMEGLPSYHDMDTGARSSKR